LNLEKQPHSLSIIKDFLNQSLSHLDYQAAYHYYFEIAMNLSLFDLVYDEGTTILKEIQNQSETLYYEKILKHLIDASIALSKFDETRRFIELRKNALPMINQYLGILDDIAYKKALNEPYLEDVLKVLQDLIPDQVKIYCLEELVILYEKDHQYDMALNQIYALYQFDLKDKYVSKEINLLTALERYDEAKSKAQQYLKEHPDQMDIVLSLIHIYYQQKDYFKASNLDAEYEDKFELQDDQYQLEAYELFVELYKAMDNKLSLDLYQKKLKKIKKSSTKKINQETIKKEKDNIVIIEKREEKQLVSKNLLKHLEISTDLIEYAHLIDEKLPLREYLRIFFMHFEKYIDAKEMMIYTNKMSPNFFYYKKERLYDKTLTPLMIDDTFVSHVMHTGEEIYELTKTFKWQKNIITQKDFDEDVSFVYAFPLGDIGVFAIYFSEVINDPAIHYDLLKLVSSILFAHLLDEQKILHFKNENHMHQQILNAPIIAYRLYSDQRSTYNDMAMQLFDIDKHHHMELFLRDVSYEYVHQYQQSLASCLRHVGEIKHLTYVYQNKHIEEKMYSFKEGDETYVMSFFYDQSKEVDKAKQLIEQATVDQSSGLYNRHALDQAMDELKEDKVSFCLVELDDHMKHIYGSEQMQQFFKEFAQVSKKFFKDAQIYRFDFNQILVALPLNDIRSVTKMLKDYVKHLDSYQSQTLDYEKFDVSIGVLRYPVVTVEKQKEKLYRFFHIALEKSKRNKEDAIYYFVYRDYEEELFEQQVIDYLNIAIETRQIGLVFNQVIDMSKNIVWQYESELVITELTIDSKYLLSVAEKRHRLVDIEHFHIEKVCEFLVELEKQTQRLIKITIPVSKQTFLDPKFNSYLLTTLKSYGIPYEFIRIKAMMDVHPKHYITQIQELLDQGIALDTTSVDMAIHYPFNALHLDIQKDSLKFSEYLKRMKEMLDEFQMALIIRGVKVKEQKEMLQRLGIKYIEGGLYKELPAPVLLRKIKDTL
jgi:EAL domain-containing protein (putative c-di-GMP-specific phosphodiesterase class I)/GGDEF domain-containing protein